MARSSFGHDLSHILHGHLGVRATAISAAATAVAVLPLFLVGALAVQITVDFGIGPAGLGLATSAFYIPQIVTAPSFGRMSDRIGAIRTLRLAVACSAAACLGIALTADHLSVLMSWLILGGFGNALAQPAGNRLLLHRVSRRRLGLAFGIRQTAPPIALLMAGLSVPFIALPFGWPWVFASAGLAAALVMLAIGQHRVDLNRAHLLLPPRDRLHRPSTVVILALAFGFAVTASTAPSVFYVHSAVMAGTAPQTAAIILAIGSASAVFVRIAAGVVCDRTRLRPLLICTWMLGLGAFGMFMLASGQPTAMAAGVVVAMAGTWGLNGVFWYGLTTAFRGAPGAITGAVSPGGFIGGTVGTVLFGFVAERGSYGTAWSLIALIGFIGMVVMRVADNRLRTAT